MGSAARWRGIAGALKIPREEDANGGDGRCRRHQERTGAVVEGAHQGGDGRQEHCASGVEKSLPRATMLGRDGLAASRVIRRGGARRSTL